jgi:predicted nucleic-acid-binding protein
MRAVDTNVLVRLITRDDPKQVTAAESFVASGAWVSHLVLAETLWVLESVYELDAKRRATAVDMLLNHRVSRCKIRTWSRRRLRTFATSHPLDFLIAWLWRSPGRRGTFLSEPSIAISANSMALSACDLAGERQRSGTLLGGSKHRMRHCEAAGCLAP